MVSEELVGSSKSFFQRSNNLRRKYWCLRFSKKTNEIVVRLSALTAKMNLTKKWRHLTPSRFILCLRAQSWIIMDEVKFHLLSIYTCIKKLSPCVKMVIFIYEFVEKFLWSRIYFPKKALPMGNFKDIFSRQLSPSFLSQKCYF